MLEAIIGIGYTVSLIGGLASLIHLEFNRDWRSRPAMSVGVLVALLGPLVALPVIGAGLWWLVGGLREAYRLVRPKQPAALPEARTVRRVP